MRKFLLLAAFCVHAACANVQQAEVPGTGFRLSGPHRHDELELWLIHGREAVPRGMRIVAVSNAIASREAVVHETGTVSALAIENLSSDAYVFVQAGDIVQGGKQDRVIAIDLLVPPKSGRVPLAAFCVEEGRWHARQGDAAMANALSRSGAAAMSASAAHSGSAVTSRSAATSGSASSGSAASSGSTTRSASTTRAGSGRSSTRGTSVGRRGERTPRRSELPPHLWFWSFFEDMADGVIALRGLFDSSPMSEGAGERSMGRARRTGSFALGSIGLFSGSSTRLSSLDLKHAVKLGKGQGAVWSGVRRFQSSLSSQLGSNVISSSSATSLALSLDAAVVKRAAAAYTGALSGIVDEHEDVIGFAFAIRGEINSADVYGSRALFVSLWPKLLEAAAVEAIASSGGAPRSATSRPSPASSRAGRPSPVADRAGRSSPASSRIGGPSSTAGRSATPGVSREAVIEFLAEAAGPKAACETPTATLQLLTSINEGNVFFETRDAKNAKVWYHRSYLARRRR